MGDNISDSSWLVVGCLLRGFLLLLFFLLLVLLVVGRAPRLACDGLRAGHLDVGPDNAFLLLRIENQRARLAPAGTGSASPIPRPAVTIGVGHSANIFSAAATSA